jgi:hypothetical protein
MNLKFLMDNFDKKSIKFYNYNFYKLPKEIHSSTSDIDNTTIIFNNDNNLKFDRFILSYFYHKNDKIKFIWSWSDLDINNNNNNEIRKLLDYGLNLNNSNNNNKFINNIKYYLINSSLYINVYELYIIFAVSLYVLNGSFI